MYCSFFKTNSKSFFLVSILLFSYFSTSVLAQRPPERIIEKEEVEKFKATLDSALCLYTTDSVYRKPILEIGNNPFIDSLIEYNLQEYAFYLNNYWYELDKKLGKNTALSFENTAPQEGGVINDFKGNGFHRKSSFCNCGREHISNWGWKEDRVKGKSDKETHYLNHRFWRRLRYYNKKNFYNRIAQDKPLFRKGIIKRGKRRVGYENNKSDYNYTRHNLDYLSNGFEKKEILEGNIGYLKCSFLASANYIDERFLKDLIKEFLFTDALILDFRGANTYKSDNKFFTKDKTINEMSVPIWFVERFLRPDTTYNLGTAKILHTREFIKDNGKPYKEKIKNPTISLITKTEKVKSYFNRNNNYYGYYSSYSPKVDKNYEKYYTLRYYERPIYILTDQNTSDAAEWIVQVLQKYRNAIVIGEPTKGQSIITKPVGTSAYSWLNIPDVIISNQDSLLKNNVVKPDIFVSSYDTTSIDKPFDIAYKMAYQESVLNNKFSYVKKYGERLRKFEEITKPIPNPYNLPQNASHFLGNYGLGKEIIFKDGKLWLKNYQHISPLYMTTTNTFLVKEGLQKEFKSGYDNPYSTVAKPIYVFFKKDLEEQNENQNENSNLNNQDSVMSMFVRYGDFTSAKFTQIEKYTFDTFKQEKQGIDTTQLIKPSAIYPFSKMSTNEKQLLFDGFTMQRNLFTAFPNFGFKLISDNEITKENLENKLSIFVFWSPTSTKSIEAIPKLNEMIEIYSENNITFYGFTEDRKKEVEEFLIGTPFYADIIASSFVFEDLYIPTSKEPFILILNKEGKFIFGEKLNSESFEKMNYILSNEILK